MTEHADSDEFVLERPGYACRALGRSLSSFYEDVAKGLMVKPAAIGKRARALFRHERQAIARARMAGKTDDEIRALVRQLHAARKAAQ